MSQPESIATAVAIDMDTHLARVIREQHLFMWDLFWAVSHTNAAGQTYPVSAPLPTEHAEHHRAIGDPVAQFCRRRNLAI